MTVIIIIAGFLLIVMIGIIFIDWILYYDRGYGLISMPRSIRFAENILIHLSAIAIIILFLKNMLPDIF